MQAYFPSLYISLSFRLIFLELKGFREQEKEIYCLLNEYYGKMNPNTVV